MGTFRQYGTYGDASRTLYAGASYRNGVLTLIPAASTTGSAITTYPYRLPDGGGAATSYGKGVPQTHPIMSPLHYWRGDYWLFGGFDSNTWIDCRSIWRSIGNPNNFINTGIDLPANVAWGASFIFNDVAYVVGGIVGNVWAYNNQMFRSYDGINWTTHETSGFTGRYSAAFFVWNNRMWILGGANTGGMVTDVVSSADGIAWTTHPKLSPLPHGYCRTMSSAAFDDRIIIAGGTNDTTNGYYGSYHEGNEGGWGAAQTLPYPSGTIFSNGLLMGTIDNPELGFVGGGLKDNSSTCNPNILVYTNQKPSVLRNLNGRVSLSGERRAA